MYDFKEIIHHTGYGHRTYYGCKCGKHAIFVYSVRKQFNKLYYGCMTWSDMWHTETPDGIATAEILYNRKWCDHISFQEIALVIKHKFCQFEAIDALDFTGHIVTINPEMRSQKRDDILAELLRTTLDKLSRVESELALVTSYTPPCVSCGYASSGYLEAESEYKVKRRRLADNKKM